MPKTEIDIYKELIASSKEYVELLEKSIQAKDAEIKRLNEYNEYGLICAAEFGYKECEKGNNLEMAIINFKKVLRGES